MASSPRRRRPLSDLYSDDLEEGEYVPGCGGGYGSSDTDEDHDVDCGGGYRFQPRREAEEEARRRPQHAGQHVRPLDDIIAAVGRVRARQPPPSPAHSWGSDDTLSDGGDGGNNPISAAAVFSAAPARTKLVCHICGKAFGSPKAVDGHMRVHGHLRHQVAAAAAAAAVSGGWAVTGRRGWTGGNPNSVAASLNSEVTGHSTAIVVAQPLQPVPMAMAVTTGRLSPVHAAPSAKTDLSGGDHERSSASAQPTTQCDVVTGAPNPSSSTGSVVDKPATPTPPPTADEQAQQVHHQPAALPPPAAQLAQLPLVPLPPAPVPAVQQQGHDQLLVATPKPENSSSSSREYSCKLCGKSYPTPQGLGGHAAGHRNKQREAEAAAAAAGMPLEAGGALLAALRGDKEVKKRKHTCEKCGKVFDRGVSLGGHMRMHYTGPPIETKRNKRMRVVAAVPPPSVVMKTEQPSPAAGGRVRLFGVDIGPLAHASSSSSDQQKAGASKAAADGSQ